MMSPIIENILIGIVTSIITGVAVWVWQKTKRTSILNKKAKFFGISSKEKCLLIMTHNPKQPSTMSHNDIYVLMEAAKIANDLDGEIVISPYDQALEGVGEVTEFCIGGPDSNQRSRAHMGKFLINAYCKPYSDVSEPLALVIGEHKFIRKEQEQEYALLAKIIPAPGNKPIFLICGQTAITNRAAIYFLEKNYERLSKEFSPGKPFCFILEVSLPKVYGHKMVSIARDVTTLAIKQ